MTQKVAGGKLESRGSSDTLRVRARVDALQVGCRGTGERIRGRNIWTKVWTTNETRQVVARVRVTEDGCELVG